MREPAVDPAVARAFDEELRRFVESAVFEDGALEGLFTSDTTYVNRALALHYGLDVVPASDDEWTRVALPADRRAGVLALGSVAAAHSSQSATSPTQRGRFVRERLLCQDIPDPPPDAAAMNPVLPDDATVRERIEARMAIPACGNCHQLMDPIGIGLEDIDVFGRHRERYEDGSVVDRAGQVFSLPPSEEAPTFEGAAELGALLAGGDELPSCMVEQWFRFAMGRREADCQTATAQRLFEESGHDLRELLLSLVESEAFVSRADGGS
jgi:hypothetical protein